MKNRRVKVQKKSVKTVKWAPFVVVALATGLALVPLPAHLVERLYATGIYAVFQPAVTFASNIATFAWLDVLIAVIAGLWFLLLVRDSVRRGWLIGFGLGALRLAVWAGAAYLLFLVTWGLNYRRPRLDERLAFDRTLVTPAAATRLAALSIDRLNALHAAAHVEGWVSAGAIDPALAGAFDRVVRELGITARGIVVGRPKRSLLDAYFTRAGVAGMTDPIFLETLIASDLLPFERPFVVAHEWGHLAGVTDEGAANLVGWLAAVRGSVADQYSGWLAMYSEAIGAVPAADRPGLAGRLIAGPRDDLRSIRERTLRNVDPRVAQAGWRIYDSYLRANRVEAGTASYAEVVRLALGLKIVPQLLSAPR